MCIRDSFTSDLFVVFFFLAARGSSAWSFWTLSVCLTSASADDVGSSHRDSAYSSYIRYYSETGRHKLSKYRKQEAFEKCWAHSSLQAAARRITIHQVSLLSHRTPPAHWCPWRRRRQRVIEGTTMAPWNGPNEWDPNAQLWVTATLFNSEVGRVGAKGNFRHFRHGSSSCICLARYDFYFF